MTVLDVLNYGKQWDNGVCLLLDFVTFFPVGVFVLYIIRFGEII